MEYRSAYTYVKKQFQNKFNKAALTARSKAILSQLQERQSFVWFGIFEEDSKEIKIEILPSYNHDDPDKFKLNKDSKPFEFEGKIIPVIVEEAPINGSFRPGRIHVAGGRELQLSEDGIGNGNSYAGGYVGRQRNTLLFASTSHNSWAFKPNPLFIHYCTYNGCANDAKRSVPYQEAYLTIRAFHEAGFKSRLCSGFLSFKNLQACFEKMTPDELRKELQQCLIFYIENQKKHSHSIELLLRECEEAEIHLNFDEVMSSATQDNNTKTILWLKKKRLVETNPAEQLKFLLLEEKEEMHVRIIQEFIHEEKLIIPIPTSISVQDKDATPDAGLSRLLLSLIKKIDLLDKQIVLLRANDQKNNTDFFKLPIKECIAKEQVIATLNNLIDQLCTGMKPSEQQKSIPEIISKIVDYSDITDIETELVALWKTYTNEAFPLNTTVEPTTSTC